MNMNMNPITGMCLSRVIFDRAWLEQENGAYPKISVFPKSFIELFQRVETERDEPRLASNFYNRGKVKIYFESGSAPYLFLNRIGECKFQHPIVDLAMNISNQFFTNGNFINNYLKNLILQKINHVHNPHIKFICVNTFSFERKSDEKNDLGIDEETLKKENYMHLTAAGNSGQLINEDKIEPWEYPTSHKTAIGTLNENKEPHSKSNYGTNIKLFTEGPEDFSSNTITSTSTLCITGILAKIWESCDTRDQAMQELYALATEKEVSYPDLQKHKIYIIDAKELTVIDGHIRNKKSALFYTVSGQFPYGRCAIKGNTKETLSEGFSPSRFMNGLRDANFSWQ